MPIPKSWVLKLPRGLREEPGWVFIGFLVTIGGVGFLTGAATSAVQNAIGTSGLRTWGGALMVVGMLVMWATIRHVPASEKLALRLLELCLLGYVGWLLTVVPLEQSAMSVLLAIVLIGLSEIRVGFLKVIINYGPDELTGGEDVSDS